ncbi:MAG: pyridoxal phosphate-dependent aminotransferase [Bacteroidales bacterium]|nr:pyridoxal phosphate-dependent aminotransferase [Bacteroidales bacterium]MCF8343458.1 pyridoxal phosphate-dependent aminotransferase [Bacteroidales bacterium]MCF8375664.1 pyridoxal phosphate-dependent aminotransferase [Bacteroidales bacterium]MCF8401462.1 pyridoxal phosphate-dependent aminotransferase [Bacteroidales bacterium]
MNTELLSTRIKRLSESATLEMTRRSRELKEKGVDVINLSIGEPDFNTPACIKEAARKAIDNNFTHYTPVAGIPELRKAISAKLKRDNQLDYDPAQIIVSNGAKQSIANTMLCLLDPGDEVLIPSPYWVSYPEMAKMADGDPVFLPATIENNFKISPQQIEEAITPKTKIFIFSSPCNPSGTVYTRNELNAIAEVLKKYKNIFIISDEIYEYINFGGEHQSIAQFNDVKEQVIIVNGVSKGYAMTGWRIGYIAAPLPIAKACDTIQGQYTSGASSIGQKAALEAIKTDPCASEDIKKMVEAFRERRSLVIDLLNEIPGMKTNEPQGAFYIFPNVRHYFGKSNGTLTVNNSKDLCLYLLDKAHVATVPGAAFGNPGCIRISYATSNELLKEALKRMRKALAELS